MRVLLVDGEGRSWMNRIGLRGWQGGGVVRGTDISMD